MTTSFLYQTDGHSFEGGWEIHHGRICICRGEQIALAQAGADQAACERIRDNVMHQLLVREGLLSPRADEPPVPFKLGWY